MSDLERKFFSTGINAATGALLEPPRTADEIQGLVLNQRFSPAQLDDLRDRHRRAAQPHFGVVEGIDPDDLSQCGWGILFPEDAEASPLKEAMSDLLQLRRSQAGERYRELIYRRGETKNQFLKRYWTGPGPVDPRRLPYYILIVGDPQAVPLRFQFELDVQFALGRIHFDRIEDYAHYARSVVDSERDRLRPPRRVVVFAPENPDDEASRLCNAHLARPLGERLRASSPGWEIETVSGESADKARLSAILHGESPSSFLFTASHGVVFPSGDPRRRPLQGALLCRDWPGPKRWGRNRPIPPEHFFGAGDLDPDARVQGMIAFHFACFSAGTTHDDSPAQSGYLSGGESASQGFLAGLPKRMLGLSGGGALASVGHVERAWVSSFLWGRERQVGVFESACRRLLGGHRLGSAMEHFSQRHAELSSMLASQLDDIDDGARVQAEELAELWTAKRDAASYMIFGDPAVRLSHDARDWTRGRSMGTHRPLESDLRLRTTPGVEQDSSEVEPPMPGRRDFGFSTGSDDRVRGSSGGPTGDERSSVPRPDQEPDAALAGDRRGAAAEDALSFSAFHPRSISFGAWQRLLVYAHLERDWQAVKSDADGRLASNAEYYGQAQAESQARIPKGTEITLAPYASGLKFNPKEVRLTWNRSWEHADFDVRADREAEGLLVEATIGCYAGPLLLAELRMPLQVGDTREGPLQGLAGIVASRAKAYRSIFASYSHLDIPLVEAVEAVCEALGYDYLRDFMKLKSGQNWSQQLLHMIEEADVFQLFWSQAASQSPYVEEEWRHALTQTAAKGEAFIRPVYWEDEMPPAPAPLAAIHFWKINTKVLVALDRNSTSSMVARKSAVSTGSQSASAARFPTFDPGLTEVTVSTYASSDPAEAQEGDLRIRSRVSLTGNTETFISESLPEDRSSDLQLHKAMVREALKARLEYLRLLAGSDPTEDPEA